MSRPSLDSTPIGIDTKNAKISLLELTPVGVKMSDPCPLKQPKESSKHKEKSRKEYVPEDI